MPAAEFETPDADRPAETTPAAASPERMGAASGEASEADLFEQAQEVDPGERVTATHLREDAPEADAWEQAQEVAPDEDWDDRP